MNYEALLEELGLDGTPQKQTSKSPQNNTRASDNTYITKTPETQQKKIKLILNVNLSSNQVEQLMIYQDEDPKLKVSEFCHLHQLDKNAQNVLLKQINSNTNSDNYQSQQKLQQQNYYSRQLQSYSTKESEQPGERLYQLAQKKREQRDNQIKQYQTEKQEQEQQQLQQTPKLSKQTKIYLEQAGYRKNGYMKEKGTLKDKQIQQVFLDEQGKEYNFVPQINELSKQMSHYIREKQHYENVFDELYEQARNRMYSQPEQDIPECTFKPSVNTNFKIDDDFLTRMEKKQEELKERRELIKMKYENVDLKTRQLLYRPKICRSPYAQTSSEKPVHEKLYLQSKLKSEKLQQMSEQKVIEEKESLNVRLKNELSEDIVFLQRKKILKQLFTEMDTNQDGQIQCSYEEINNLTPNIIQTLWPIFKYLQEQKRILDFDDFFQSVYEYCINLPQIQKDVIFKKSKNNYLTMKDQDYTFTPKTNKKSKSMNTVHYPSCKCEICTQIAIIQRQLNDK
ncbi:unnamed protein product [Paramecium sonneborni]|uniref:EF-hand domain-containing protein n=1 Tax=Paramecium sonneborni TaxID=65129 RepID=A0A8S1JSP1_9CILI|nr:unnamed protein product [Paramecium sonneborni]